MNGTLVNYYFHCKRQCYLFGNGLNMENNSEDVHIGREIHRQKEETQKNTEISIHHIRLDKLTKEYLTEVKKSDADVTAAKWQLLYYLKELKKVGLRRKGKLEIVENKRKDKKTYVFELTQKEEQRLIEVEQSIKDLITDSKAPDPLNSKLCKKCAYYEYCYL